MKTCFDCGKRKAPSEFDKNKAKVDGLQNRCRPCKKRWDAAYYAATKDSRRAKRQASKDKIRFRNQAIVLEALQSGCLDCGTTDIRVLEFDHVDDNKEFNIGSFMHCGSEVRLRTEIEKCEVVCANCHRIRSGDRGAWWRTHIHHSRLV